MRFRFALLLGLGVLAGIEGVTHLIQGTEDDPAPAVGSTAPATTPAVMAAPWLEVEPTPAIPPTGPGAESLRTEEEGDHPPTTKSGSATPWADGLRVRLELDSRLGSRDLQPWLADNGSFLVLLRLGLGADADQHQLVIRGGILPGPDGLPERPARSSTEVEDLIRAHPAGDYIWAGPIERGPVLESLLRASGKPYDRYLPFLVLGSAPSRAIWRNFRALLGPESPNQFSGTVIVRLVPGHRDQIDVQVELSDVGGER